MNTSKIAAAMFYVLAGVGFGVSILSAVSAFYGAILVVPACAGGVALITAMLLSSTVDAPVDIWRIQRRLMDISGQKMPDLPRLSRDSFLYAALLLEELGELHTTLRTVVLRQRRPDGTVATTATTVEYKEADWPLRAMVDYMATNIVDLQQMSKSLKAAVSQLTPEFWLALTRSEAAAVLDDITDVTVVAAGFAMASGMPASEAYSEVLESNLSKADPTTGMIEKEPSGKWIKGRGYHAPNLAAVLDAQYRDFAEND